MLDDFRVEYATRQDLLAARTVLPMRAKRYHVSNNLQQLLSFPNADSPAVCTFKTAYGILYVFSLQLDIDVVMM